MYHLRWAVRPEFLEDATLRAQCLGRKVLVTGGDGFLGSYLATAFQALGSEVSIVSRRKTSLLEGSGIRIFRGHLLQRELLEHAFEGQEIIFDFAGSSGAVDSNRDPLRNLAEECEPHLNAFQIAAGMPRPPLVVFCSSRTVYGKAQQLPVSESHRVAPESVYAIHKLTLEQYLQTFGQGGRLAYLIFRLSNPYGALVETDYKTYGVLNKFIRSALVGQTIRLFGDGSQRRDYIHIDDAVEAFVRTSLKDECRNQVFNLGGPEAISIRDAVGVLLDENPGSRIEHETWPEDYFAVETGDYVSDVGKLSRFTGFVPSISFRNGIRRTLAAYRARRALEDPGKNFGTSGLEASVLENPVRNGESPREWNWKGKRVLVTGASGFLGSELVGRLLAMGASVAAVHRRPVRQEWRDARGFLSLAMDLDNAPDLTDRLSGFKPQIIYHLASRPDGRETSDHANAGLRTNVLATLNLLEAAHACSPEAFVFAGSAKVFGNSPVPHREASTVDPQSSYAASKLAAWNYGQVFARIHGVPAVALHSTLIYGPAPGANLFTFLANNLRASKPVIELSGGSQTRDPIYLDDAIDAYLCGAIHARRLQGRAIPIGGGNEKSVKELAEMFIHAAGYDTPVRVCGEKIRETEMMRSYCDNLDARDALGWEPKTRLEEGLRRTARYLLGADSK